jgi:hypothetical protein
MIAVGAPLLGAVEHVVVAAADRGRLERGGVRAGAGLGELSRRPAALRWPAPEGILLLRLAAEEEDGQPAERLIEVLRGGARAGRRDLFGDQGQRQASQVGPAVRLGHPDAVETGLDERADGVLRVRFGLVVAGRVRRDPLAGDLPRQVADRALVLGEVEEVVHGPMV